MRMHVYLLACSTAALVFSRGARMQDSAAMTTESTGPAEEASQSVAIGGDDSDPWAYDDDFYTLLDVEQVYHYYMSVVPFFGLLTNGLAVYVFLHRGKTEQTVNMLLIALSISDSLALTSFMDIAVHFWSDHEWSFQQSTDVGCRMVQYITNVARDCSSYFILTFTVDRFVAVWYPLKRGTIVTKRRAQLTVAGILFLCFAMELYVPILNQHYSWEYVSGCAVSKPLLNAELLTYLRNTVGFIVPAAAVAILNALIIKRLRSYENQRDAMTSGDGKESKKSKQQSRALTIMLVTVSTFSFLSATPKTVYFIWLAYADWAGWEYSTYAYIVEMVLAVNYTCNFFFYCLSGSQFRRDLVQAFCGRGPGGKNRGSRFPATMTSNVSTVAQERSVAM